MVMADWGCAVGEGDEANNIDRLELLFPDPVRSAWQGLQGYIYSGSNGTPEAFRYGAGFYSAVWSLVAEPVANFQIGLPSTWVTPDNRDNRDQPLCPVGTVARDNWPERAPTYQDVFQTLEGGLGYWVGNRFHYGPPKFSMNSTPDCYTNQIASPGWPFFGRDRPLPDALLGIAQLSNRLLIPPDALPFQGQPRGELLGYAYMALPLTEPRPDPQPTGNQNWTLFLNAANFKGPLAYYLPETWSRISRNHPFGQGRGLDARRARDRLGGTMEINTVPQFVSADREGTVYTKIPQLQFPVDAEGRSVLVREVAMYSRAALYDAVAAWKNGGEMPSGTFDREGMVLPAVNTAPVTYRQNDVEIEGINELVTPTVYEGGVFGLQWAEPAVDGFGRFPQYFRAEGNRRIAVDAADVPPETFLHGRHFDRPDPDRGTYSAQPLAGAWMAPGPAAGPFQAALVDCSSVTYYWYRFIDQPVFVQYDWTPAEKDALQSLVEQIHTHWPIDREYLPPPGAGELVSSDAGLLVTPPEGLEVGYVPIVTHQTRRCGAGEGD